MARPLTPGERRLAESVFGEALDPERITIRTHPFGRFAFVVGDAVFMPPGVPADFSAATLNLQAWLAHELTHVWQFRTRPFWTLRSWLACSLTGGYGRGQPAYRYTAPVADFAACNLEQQARIVEHAFLARCGRIPAPLQGLSLSAIEACLPFTGSREGGPAAADPPRASDSRTA